jgi:hypothetical protein
VTIPTLRKFGPRIHARRARLVTLDAVERRDFAEQRDSLAAFWAHVLGEDKAPASHHREWIDLIDLDQDNGTLTKIAGPNLELRGPRDSAKSTFAYILAAWAIGWNPGIRLLYLSYSEAIALEQSRKIKRLISSPRYREVFPWIKLGARKDVTNWEVDKAFAAAYGDKPDRIRIATDAETDATFTLYAAGVLGSVMGKRADLCIVDDAIKSAEAIASAEVRQKILDNMDGVVSPCLVNNSRWIDVGMLARRGDIHLSYFTEANGFQVHQTKAIATEADGTERSYWPERHPLEQLQARRNRAPHIFALQYQNEPPQDSDDAIILEDWIHWGQAPKTFDELWLSIDLAATERQRADYTAFVLFGKLRSPLHYWALECSLFKESGNLGKLRRLRELRESLGRPFRIVCEGGGYQNSFEGDYRDYVQREAPELQACSLVMVPSSRDLRQRLVNISGVMENQLVSFDENGPGLRQVAYQLVNAHTDDLDHDDAASSFGIGLRAMIGRGAGRVWTA